MEPVAFVEILDRRGRVMSRAKLPRLPATVGRGYGNDVIVDDPYVCVEHLRISRAEDGALVAEDLGSVNGTRLAGNSEPRRRVALDGDVSLRIGRTLLRVREPRQPLAPTRPDPHRAGGAARLHPLAASLVVVALCSASLALDAYASRFGKFEPLQLASEIGFALLGLTFWAGGWAVVNRIVAHEYRFSAHCAIASAAAMAYTVIYRLSDTLVFLLSPDRTPALLPLVVWTLLVGLLLSSHISLFSSLGRWRRTAAAMLVSLAILGVFHLRQEAFNTGFSNALEFPGEIAPIPTRWLRPADPDSYFEKVAILRETVDALAAEEKDRG